jgi:hypothetical protein
MFVVFSLVAVDATISAPTLALRCPLRRDLDDAGPARSPTIGSIWFLVLALTATAASDVAFLR